MTRLTALLVLILTIGAGAGGAQDQSALQSTRKAAIAAFESGDTDTALALSEQAVSIARSTPGTPATETAHALSALAFLLTAQTTTSKRAQSLWYEALALLGEAGQMATDAGVSVLINLGEYELGQGHRARALARLNTALGTARGTQLHGVAAKATHEVFLKNGAYPQAVRALGELTDVAPQLLNTTFGALYTDLSALAEQAEAEGRANDVVTLLEGKQILLRQYLPEDQATDAIRNLFFQRFFALRQTGDFQRVQNELTLWLTTAEPTQDERQFIGEMADLAMQLAQGANINSLERLNDARMAMAFVAGLEQPDDYRLGLAFRAIASGESHLGQIAQVDRTLGQAIDILERSKAGRRYLPAVLSELAWNAFLQGDVARAESLFARADQVQNTVAELVGPAAASDRANDAANRARFHLDTGEPDQALHWVAQSRKLARLVVPDPWQSAFLNSRLIQTSLLARLEAGQGDTSVDPLLGAIDALRAVTPPNNPEYAMALVNAADTALVLGRTAIGRSLLKEAIAINDTALPAVAPQAIDTLAALARLDLLSGDHKDAVALLRRVGDARKSPLYRTRLSEAAIDFELLAWLLLGQSRTGDPEILNEAFEALQWTQITQSASALSYLETRMAVDDPERSTLIRQRQNLVDAHAAASARLALARTAAADDGSTIAGLISQLGQMETGLAGADTRLNALGLDTGDIGRVVPVSVAEVQAMLGPDEALITFLLPSLNPDVIAGLEASSNHVIAVTADEVRVARIGEVSRRGLNRRITAFRCDMATSDPGCARGGARGLRGAMLDGDDDKLASEDFFDHAAAYALYDDLFGGIQDVLESHERLIIVPPADMLRLPFQALVTAPATGPTLADTRWMIRQNAISVLPSVASLRALRKDTRAIRRLTRMAGFGDPAIGALPDADCDAFALAALRAAPPLGEHMSLATGPGEIALADPDFLNSLERLPDSRCELRAIGARFDPVGTRLFLGRDATESRVRALNESGELAGFDVLVFSTHGLTGGEAGAASPGLVLTPPGIAGAHDDGLLTAAEIAGLDLNAQLVVLSACNTAAGEGGTADGLSGLARAFFRAGAQSMLVTHWSVYSQSAVDVSTGLFGELDHRPQEPFSMALRAATLEILNDRQRPPHQYHPSYWAAFSIIGAT